MRETGASRRAQGACERARGEASRERRSDVFQCAGISGNTQRPRVHVGSRGRQNSEVRFYGPSRPNPGCGAPPFCATAVGQENGRWRLHCVFAKAAACTGAAETMDAESKGISASDRGSERGSSTGQTVELYAPCHSRDPPAQSCAAPAARRSGWHGAPWRTCPAPKKVLRWRTSSCCACACELLLCPPGHRWATGFPLSPDPHRAHGAQDGRAALHHPAGPRRHVFPAVHLHLVRHLQGGAAHLLHQCVPTPATRRPHAQRAPQRASGGVLTAASALAPQSNSP